MEKEKIKSRLIKVPIHEDIVNPKIFKIIINF